MTRIVRPEQEKIDRVVAGEEHGHYYLLLGEKGCGKTSMILDAMHKVDGLGIAMMECHAGSFTPCLHLTRLYQSSIR